MTFLHAARRAAVVLAAMTALLASGAAPSDALVIDPRPGSPNYCWKAGNHCWRVQMCDRHQRRSWVLKRYCARVNAHGWR